MASVTTEDKSIESTSFDETNISTIAFALFPNQILRASLHLDVPYPQKIAEETYSIQDNTCGEKYALMNADTLVSFKQVTIAANNALLKNSNVTSMNNSNIDSCSSKPESTTTTTNNQKKRRGLALESIVCSGGSSNVGNVLRDHTFEKNNDTKRNVLILGFNCTAKEYNTFLTQSGLDKYGPCPMDPFWKRERSTQQTNELMKLYKISPNEITMNGSVLEDAVLTRIATKYIT